LFKALIFAIGYLGCVIICQSSFAIEVKDDAGNTVTLPEHAKRVVSLAPDITEILFAIGANEKIVGVIAGSNFPLAANSLPAVGSYAGLDQEKIYSLHPDLIVTWKGNFSSQLNFFRAQHIPIYVVHPQQLADVMQTMRHLGILLGIKPTAEQAAHYYQQQLEHLVTNYHYQKKVTVFYQIGPSLFTINRDSWINQAIDFCGGENIFAALPFSSLEVDEEAVIAANPNVIISDGTGNNSQSRWLKFTQMDAVQHKQLYTVPADLIERAGPRLILGVQKICEIIQKVRNFNSNLQSTSKPGTIS